MCVGVYAHMLGKSCGGQKRALGPRKAENIDVCELPNVSAGFWTLVFLVEKLGLLDMHLTIIWF